MPQKTSGIEEATALAYQRKTRDEYVLVGNWGGYGWEEVLTEDSYKEIKQRYREYVENDKRADYKIKKRRVPIDKQT